jgi:manganese/zinc/iron transport system substrate-binding protein
VLTRLGRSKKYVYAVTDSIDKNRLIQPPESVGHHDPHVWFDVNLWSMCIDTVVMGLSAFDPAGKPYYEKRGQEYRARMRELHEWSVQRVGELPIEKRILATSHDAFNYFGRAYEFQVVGLQGISTATDVSLSDLVAMVEFIKRNGVKAVFVESSVPHKTIERVSRDANVKIGGELFSDALGTPGQKENGYDLGTYEGMIRHNVNTIVNALK